MNPKTIVNQIKNRCKSCLAAFLGFFVNSETSKPRLTVLGLFVSKIITPLLLVSIVLVTLKQIGIQTEQLQEQSKQLAKQSENAQRQISAEQFKNAIEHLGSDKTAVVLGGIYALFQLATDDPSNYMQSVINVFCAFVREETAKPEYQANILKKIDPFYIPDESEISQHRISQKVIANIVDLLSYNIGIVYHDDGSYSAYERHLEGAFLPLHYFGHLGSLVNVDYIHQANLQEINLWRADLRGADFRYAKLYGANLGNANLRGARLWHADLSRARLWNADLRGASLQGTAFQELDADVLPYLLDAADFRGVQSGTDKPWLVYQNAVKNNLGLVTDLSGIIIYDASGNELENMTEEQKKLWFQWRGVDVRDLSAKDVQNMSKIFKEVWKDYWED